MKKFTEWKGKSTLKLLILIDKYHTDEEILKELNYLLYKLRNAKRRDLSTILLLVHSLIKEKKLTELIDLIPSEELLSDILMEK